MPPRTQPRTCPGCGTDRGLGEDGLCDADRAIRQAAAAAAAKGDLTPARRRMIEERIRYNEGREAAGTLTRAGASQLAKDRAEIAAPFLSRRELQEIEAAAGREWDGREQAVAPAAAPQAAAEPKPADPAPNSWRQTLLRKGTRLRCTLNNKVIELTEDSPPGDQKAKCRVVELGQSTGFKPGQDWQIWRDLLNGRDYMVVSTPPLQGLHRMAAARQDHTCPKCGAAPGDACTSDSGRLIAPHKERLREVDRAAADGMRGHPTSAPTPDRSQTETRPSCVDQVNAALFQALHERPGARERWAKRRSLGLGLLGLRQALEEEWPDPVYGYHPQPWMARAGVSPEFWIGDRTGRTRPDLYGPILIARIRELLDIPTPSEREEKPNMAVAVATPQPGQKCLPLDAITPSPLNPRRTFDEESLRELAASMEERGLLQPIVVFEHEPGRYRLIAGERRWRAAQLLEWTQIPAIIRAEPTEKEARILMLIENLQREDLSPIDEAQALRDLYESGMPQGEIAKSIGRTQSYVANAIRLLGLPQAVQDRLARGELTPGHGKWLLAWADDPERCAQIAETAADPLSRLKVSHLEQMAKNEGRIRSRKSVHAEEPDPEAGSKGGAVDLRREGAALPVATARCSSCKILFEADALEEGLCVVCRSTKIRPAAPSPLEIPRPTREEWEARRERELQEIADRRSERQEEVAALAYAIDHPASRVPALHDAMGLALVAERVLGGIPNAVIESILAARGLEHLMPDLDWTGEDRRTATWEQLAALEPSTLGRLMIDAILAHVLSDYEETGREPLEARWYCGEAVSR